MSARRLGLLWALGGAITGCIVGAALGLIVVLVMCGRSAPVRQGAAYTGSGTLDFVGLIAAIALGLRAVLQLREAPLKYNGRWRRWRWTFARDSARHGLPFRHRRLEEPGPKVHAMRETIRREDMRVW